MEKRREAVLLLGPTGSGKTPLGTALEAHGLNGRACRHFDFGENLRRVVARGEPNEIVSRADIEFLTQVLDAGALLEDKDFPIAERILRSFLSSAGDDEDALVILNGLPRHVGQAQRIGRILDIHTVVYLECSPVTVLARILANTGGDRTDRVDDDLAAVRQKLAVFADRTKPLVDLFRDQGARIFRVSVTAEMTPDQMRQAIMNDE